MKVKAVIANLILLVVQLFGYNQISQATREDVTYSVNDKSEYPLTYTIQQAPTRTQTQESSIFNNHSSTTLPDNQPDLNSLNNQNGTNNQIFLPFISANKNGRNNIICDHTIGLTTSIADGRTNYADVSSGDTVCIEAGTRDYLILSNFAGTAQKPITFINFGGQVVIDSTKNGIAILNSQHFRITGTGSDDEYGIKIIRSEGHGIFTKNKSSHFEIDHIEVANANEVGILSGDFANCSDGSTNNYDYDGDGQIKGDLDDIINRDNFTQVNTLIHHNYIHHTRRSGVYIGSSFYSNGRQIECATCTVNRYDTVWSIVFVIHNSVAYTGM